MTRVARAAAPSAERGAEVAPSRTTSATYDTQDRLLTHGTFTYTYTANGELATKTDTATNQTTIYAYDALGNLLSVSLPNGTLIEYVVDGNGRRVGKKVNGTLVKRWLYADQLRPVAELDGAGTLVSAFVYGSKPNVPDLMVRGGVQYRIVSDQLGSVRLVVNATTGAVAQRMRHDAWGKVLEDTSAGFVPFGFAGGMYDADTGLVRFGARDYEARVGRWVSKDPIRFQGGQANIYAYVGNEPVNGTDATGLRKDLRCIENCEERFNSSLDVCKAIGGLGGAVVGTCVRLCLNSSVGFGPCMASCAASVSVVTSACAISTAVDFAACAYSCPDACPN